MEADDSESWARSWRVLATALAMVCQFPCLAFASESSQRVWEFDLRAPGTYKVQVQHDLIDADGVVPGVTKVTYAITIGTQTQTRELLLVANQPFIPLITDIAAAQRMRVAINGLSKPVLQRTAVHAFDASTVPPGEYFDPKKNDFREAKAVRRLLHQSPESIDLVKAKLAIDKMIDPKIDVESNQRQLDSMVAQIRLLPEFGDSSTAKLLALKKYVYEPGPWNGHRAFEYDLQDPLGTRMTNKLLPTYLVTRKGNCVTMPLLVVLLGQRLGIDVTVATAPKHILVKWKNEAGAWINLEATSGTNPARDVWIRQQMPMTDEALANGIYMQPLTRTETLAVIANTLAEHYLAKEEYEKSIAIADIVLERYPKAAETMVLKAVAFGRLTRQKFMAKYPSPAQIPPAERGYFQYLSDNNHRWFAQAEALGWREERAQDEQRYLETVDQARQRPTPIK
jgi:regulator of sirC expression with transglutaminase-like and TPR domain